MSQASIPPGTSAADAVDTVTQPTPASFAEALRLWLRLGFTSFGGPAGQVAIMHRELVEQKRWISERRFLHALSYCMLLPGPEAQKLAIYIGWLMHRTWGGIAAGVLFVLPSLFMLIGLSWAYMAFGQVGWMTGAFYGIKPAVAAIVTQAVWRMGRRTLRSPRHTPLLWLIALGSFTAVTFLQLSLLEVAACAALAGALGAKVWPKQFEPANRQALAVTSTKAAWLDDHTPAPVHARFTVRRLVGTLVFGVALWLLSMGVLIWWGGWNVAFIPMELLYSKDSPFTLGGAYAFLPPYLYQGAAPPFYWFAVSQIQAPDETTPGLLMMLEAYVGLLRGWSHQVLGPGHQFVGAALGAMVVTWFIFLPSFIFILAGGPVVESLRGKRAMTAPLTGISAAVVGVIASLGAFFLVHLAHAHNPGLRPAGVDWIALAMTAIVALVLNRWRWGVLPIIFVCAVLGVGLKWAGWA